MRNNWLKSRGKEQYIEFEEEEMRQLREYFGSLDDDGSGSIGVDELEDPLIALGLVDNRQQVKKIVEMVDDEVGCDSLHGQLPASLLLKNSIKS